MGMNISWGGGSDLSLHLKGRDPVSYVPFSMVNFFIGCWETGTEKDANTVHRWCSWCDTAAA